MQHIRSSSNSSLSLRCSMYAGLTNNELAIRKLADFVEVFKEELTFLGVYDSAKTLSWEKDVLPQLITANTMGVQAFVDINDFETLLILVSDYVSEERKAFIRGLYTGTTTERRNRLWRNVKFFLSIAKQITSAAEEVEGLINASTTR